MPRKPDPTFDPDFAGPAQWAAIYRAYGLQIIPCYSPSEVKPGTAWKRPALSEWVPLQEALVSDATFARWYDAQTGEHRNRRNMGILTGRASDNAYIIDLDTHKNQAAMDWWLAILEVHNSGLPLETPAQRTGGGGLQLLFKAPPGFIVPTNRTTMGVDIRGQGGFAVLPSSLHESGEFYEWLPGRAPWEIAILDVAGLAAGGGHQAGGGSMAAAPPAEGSPNPTAAHLPQTTTASATSSTVARSHMRDMVWRCVIELAPAAPIAARPQGVRGRPSTSLRRNRPKARNPANPTSRTNMRWSGRGAVCQLFKAKWHYAMGQWDAEMAAGGEAQPDPTAWVEQATAASSATAARSTRRPASRSRCCCPRRSSWRASRRRRT